MHDQGTLLHQRLHHDPGWDYEQGSLSVIMKRSKLNPLLIPPLCKENNIFVPLTHYEAVLIGARGAV